MGLKMSGSFDADALTAKIQQVGERAVRGGADQLRKEAEEVQLLAQMFAPVYSGALEDAIEVGEDRDEKNRVEVFVYVDPAATNHGDFVADYGLVMHRYQEPAGSKYGLGRRSLIKQTQLGVLVGGGYLKRAMQARLGAIKRGLRNAMKRAV